MKMKPIVFFVAAGVLLSITASGQEGPIRILPTPQPDIVVDVEPAPPPPNFFPGQDFPEPPMEPDEGWAEPGFPGEMMMPPMPGRYKILTVQLPQAGKHIAVVLKLDTQTGETWQLKVTESNFFLNGKQQIRTQLNFERVGQAHDPRRGHDHGHGGVMPGRQDSDEVEGDEDRVDTIEAVPVRPQPRRNRAPRREP